jgi:hypothetical protein
MTQVPVRLRESKTAAGPCCEAAARVAALGNELVAWLEREAVAELRINQAKLMLLERYVAERNGAPIAHRDRVVGNDGKLCLHGQFLAAYHRLHTIQMEAFPPPLEKPPRPAKAKPAPPDPPEPVPFEGHLPPEVRLPRKPL